MKWNKIILALMALCLSAMAMQSAAAADYGNASPNNGLLSPPNDGIGYGRFTITDYAPEPLPAGIVDLDIASDRIIISTTSKILVVIPAGTELYHSLGKKTSVITFGEDTGLSYRHPIEIDLKQPLGFGIVNLDWNGYHIAGGHSKGGN